MGEPLTANNLWIYSTADRHINYGVTVKDGVATVRLNTPLADTYAVEGYQGSTAITEGCTLSLGQINITCDGMGVALPMENWEATSTYNVLEEGIRFDNTDEVLCENTHHQGLCIIYNNRLFSIPVHDDNMYYL